MHLALSSKLRNRALLALTAGFGAGVGFVCYEGVLAILHSRDHQVEFVVLTALLFGASVLLLDPVREGLHRAFGGAGDHAQPQSVLLTLALILLVVAVEEAFRAAAGPSPIAASRNVSIAMVMAGGLTFVWTLGKAPFSRAWLYGLLYGLIVGTATVLLIWFSHGGALVTAGRLVDTPFTVALRVAFSNAVLYWAPLGFVGGLALRVSPPRTRQWIVGATILVAGFLLDWPLVDWRPNIFSNLGWATALIVRAKQLAAESKPPS